MWIEKITRAKKEKKITHERSNHSLSHSLLDILHSHSSPLHGLSMWISSSEAVKFGHFVNKITVFANGFVRVIQNSKKFTHQSHMGKKYILLTTYKKCSTKKNCLGGLMKHEDGCLKKILKGNKWADQVL